MFDTEGGGRLYGPLDRFTGAETQGVGVSLFDTGGEVQSVRPTRPFHGDGDLGGRCLCLIHWGSKAYGPLDRFMGAETQVVGVSV